MDSGCNPTPPYQYSFQALATKHYLKYCVSRHHPNSPVRSLAPIHYKYFEITPPHSQTAPPRTRITRPEMSQAWQGLPPCPLTFAPPQALPQVPCPRIAHQGI